jgi:hypothetical protein
MPRTTLDIDAPILRDLKRLQKRERKPLGRLVSDLLAKALRKEEVEPKAAPFRWISKPMGPPRVDLENKDALWAALEAPGPRKS